MIRKAKVCVQIDQPLKEAAEEALSCFGLSISDAMRMSLTYISRNKALPVDIKIPNAATRAAMIEAGKMSAEKNRLRK